MFFSLLLIGAVAAVPNAREDTPLKVALPERQTLTRGNGDADPLFLVHLNDTLKKYNSKVQLPSYTAVNKLLNTAWENRKYDEPLTDFIDRGVADVYYYGSIVVGQQQNFTVNFDTASADLYIPGKECTQDAGCHDGPKYDETGVDRGSTTTIGYGDGTQVTGENYFDNVTIGGLTAQNQGLVSLTKSFDPTNPISDGVLGLAFRAISASHSTPFFENLIAQKQVKIPEFGFYLGRARGNTAQNSELIIGGRDTTKFTGRPTVVAVTNRGYWQVALDSVSVNGKVSPRSKGQAAIDTGTSLILVPSLAAFATILQIPGVEPIPLADGVNLFAYPCNTDPKNIPAITFAGVKFPINPRDFNYGRLTDEFAEAIGSQKLLNFLDQATEPYCLSAIAVSDIDLNQNLYIVGDAFLKNWYSIFSYTAGPRGRPAVLFAKSVN